MGTRRPCAECPWRRDVPPGQFPACRYEALQRTSPAPDGTSAPLDAPWFACHLTIEGRELPCAGWLAVEGHNHVGVRLAVCIGQVDPAALRPGDDWPDLYRDYAEMAEKMGAPDAR